MTFSNNDCVLQFHCVNEIISPRQDYADAKEQHIISESARIRDEYHHKLSKMQTKYLDKLESILKDKEKEVRKCSRRSQFVFKFRSLFRSIPTELSNLKKSGEYDLKTMRLNTVSNNRCFKPTDVATPPDVNNFCRSFR